MYDLISEIYEDIFPVDKSAVIFTKERIAGGRILDIGCGTGEFDSRIAGKDTLVTGIDLDGAMIKKASSSFPGGNPLFMRMDMRTAAGYFTPGNFDGIISYGNTLVHITDTDEMQSFLSGIRTLIQPEGKLLLQILNYDYIIDNDITELPAISTGRFTFRRNYTFDSKTGLIKFTITLQSDETIHTESVLLNPIRSGRLEELLVDAGFRNTILYGGFGGEKFDIKKSFVCISESTA